ncbi:phosphoserine phosphatase SerB [Salsipaludibacter albus]|uniref:phosphoserine phosphatase SerB n=1 Tax=Salsipaludibacter albus TaxID=2849650 RepID=UPI001EE49AF3|nr:phosphoserine phosphatase SerB [Salsipaludibacter albus]MBY5162356.1 phosphoserine phosphatase SerB [Salsipaludibacter albus]
MTVDSADPAPTGRTVLIRVSGHDRPGITAGLLELLAGHDVDVYDMEQVVVRERLTLDVLVGVSGGDDSLKDALFWAFESGVQLDFEMVEPTSTRAGLPRTVVTTVGSHDRMTPAALGAITRAIAAAGGNIDRILRLARYPVRSFEFVVVDGDSDELRTRVVEASAEHGVDVAVQRGDIVRRGSRLVVMDVDSTLIRNEVIDLLAEEVGVRDEVVAITESAMAGELDFATSLRRRVALFADVPVEVLDRVYERVDLTAGARTFVRTLKRLGFKVALVSGGFGSVVRRLADDVGVSRVAANELEVVDGRLTGRLVGEIVDRAGKARVLESFAAANDIPMSQTVAIGDGANDLDMLAVAGLGIAFNAKPIVAESADTAITVPYLDAILFLLGIRREEVEAADVADPAVETNGLVAIPGTPPA